MINDIRKNPLASALRAVVEEKIATLDLAALADYGDRIYDAAPGTFEDDTALDTALFRAVRDAREQIADDRRTAGRIEEARKRRAGQSDDEYRARMTEFGLDPLPEPQPQPSFRVITPQERADWMVMVASIQRREGESAEAWQARYKRFKETGETDLPDDVRARLRQDGESVESYLERLKKREGGDE